MIARHDGAIVFVSGAIPGEVVEAEIEKVQRGTGVGDRRGRSSSDRPIASTARPTAPAAARCSRTSPTSASGRSRARSSRTPSGASAGSRSTRPPTSSARRSTAIACARGCTCGTGASGSSAKARTRCATPAPTRQLRDDTIDVIRRARSSARGGDRGQWSARSRLPRTSTPPSARCHLELLADADPSRLAALTQVDGVTGVTCAQPDNPRTMELWGSPIVSDTIAGARLARHVRSFFQGNRFLLQPFVEHVLSHVDDAGRCSISTRASACSA